MCCHFSRVQLFVMPWTVSHLAPLSVGFSKKEYWSGLPLPSPGDLPNPGIEPLSLKSCIAGGFFTTSATWTATKMKTYNILTITAGNSVAESILN